MWRQRILWILSFVWYFITLTVFWDMTSYKPAYRKKRFGEMYCLHFQCSLPFLELPKLWHLQTYTVSYPRGSEYSSASLREP
jgi:hypothetical protein